VVTSDIESDDSDSDITSLHEKEDDVSAVDDTTSLSRQHRKWSSNNKVAMHSTNKRGNADY